jgi:hypothetical protein
MLERRHYNEITSREENMSKPYPADVLKKLKVLISAWRRIDPALKVGKLSVAELEATLERGEALRQEIVSLENRLIDLRNKRDDAYSTAWNYIVRARAGVKGIYGDDSSEYEMMGGTRRSERKPRSKKAKQQVTLPQAT